MSPEVVASFPSMITYHWMQSVLSRGYNKEAIEKSDLYELTPSNRAENAVAGFNKEWDRKMAKWHST